MAEIYILYTMCDIAAEFVGFYLSVHYEIIKES